MGRRRVEWHSGRFAASRQKARQCVRPPRHARHGRGMDREQLRGPRNLLRWTAGEGFQSRAPTGFRVQSQVFRLRDGRPRLPPLRRPQGRLGLASPSDSATRPPCVGSLPPVTAVLGRQEDRTTRRRETPPRSSGKRRRDFSSSSSSGAPSAHPSWGAPLHSATFLLHFSPGCKTDS